MLRPTTFTDLVNLVQALLRTRDILKAKYATIDYADLILESQWKEVQDCQGVNVYLSLATAEPAKRVRQMATQLCSPGNSNWDAGI